MSSQSNVSSNEDLQRGLDNRHIQLIAIGGAIGTGLFMGSGKTISVSGPSIMLVYAIIGFMLFFVMRAMGELLLSNSNYNSFIDFSADLLGAWAGFFIGWSYWLYWIVTGVADLIAIASYAQYWWPELSGWVPVSICILSFVALNMVAVKLFGELEFWFALIKVVAIIAVVLAGLAMCLVGFQAPNGTVVSLANAWNDGNLFPNGLMGFFAGFQIAVFAFVGIELAGTAAAEVKNPERTLPKAINSIPVRVIMFYVLSLLIIMTVTPWNQIDPSSSPFVYMFTLIGIPIAAGLVNFIVLTSAASSANSGVFSTSRMLYGLAHKDGAPKALGKLASHGVPVNALLFSCLCIIGAYAVLSMIPSVMAAFTFITTIASLLSLFVWSIILLSYIAYRRNRPELHQQSIFKMPGGVFMCYVVLAFFAAVLVFLSFETDTRTALMYAPLWFIFLTVFYLFSARKKYHE